MLLVLALLGCGKGASPGPVTGPATVATTLAACAQYETMPDVYGYCLTQRVVRLPNLADMETLCGEAATWERQCHAAWVDEQGRLNVPHTPDEWLRACGPSNDCAFQVLDTKFGGDVLDAIGRCETHVQKYLSDCVAHALHRWVVETHPDDADAARVLAGAPAHAQLVAQFTGMADACFGTTHCDPTRLTPFDEACRASRENYLRGPIHCPTH